MIAVRKVTIKAGGVDASSYPPMEVCSESPAGRVFTLGGEFCGLCANFTKSTMTRVVKNKDYRGRHRRCRRPPAQIRTWSITSYGSCLESSAKSFVRIRMDDMGTGKLAPRKTRGSRNNLHGRASRRGTGPGQAGQTKEEFSRLSRSDNLRGRTAAEGRKRKPGSPLPGGGGLPGDGTHGFSVRVAATLPEVGNRP